MELFTGIVSLFFYTFIFGLIVNPRAEAYHFEDWLAEIIAKSLLYSWMVVFVSYFLNLPNLLWVLMPLTIILLFLRRRKVILKFDFYSLVFFALILGVGIRLLIRDYELIFMQYDAVVSWNRWGKELAENHYEPVNSCYPLLFPGIWSLIYKALGSTGVWVIPKLSLWVTPLLIAFACIAVIRKNIVAGLYISVLATMVFYFNLSEPLLNGYMDGPVAAFSFVAITFMVLAFKEGEFTQKKTYLYLAAITAGLGANVKQGGFLVLLCIIVAVLYQFLRKQIKKEDLVELILVALIPIALYFLIFLQADGKIIGNFNRLQQLSEVRTSGQKWLAAFNHLKATSGDILFYITVSASFLNVLWIKKKQSHFGLFLLVMALAGFYFYQDCCSYAARNGWWIMALLSGSALSSFLHLATFPVFALRKLRVDRVFVALLLIGAAGVLAFGLSQEDIESKSETLSQKLIPRGVNVLDHLDTLNDAGVIISSHLPMAHHKALTGRFAITFDNFKHIAGLYGALQEENCHFETEINYNNKRKHKPLEEVLQCKPNSLIHVRKNQWDQMVKNNPEYRFKTVDSLYNYMLVRPIRIDQTDRSGK